MNPTPSITGCLTRDQLQRFFAEKLAESQIQAIEEHVTQCDSCRMALESFVGDESWWHEAESTLNATVAFEEVATRGLSGDRKELTSSAMQDVLHLLGPTDDPHKLGRVGPYEIAGLIGRGGMGVVFKALDPALNRFVAIKMLLPHLAASEAARFRFAREGQAAAAVVDDHVLPIFAVDQWREVPYLVMQYSRSITLQKRVNEQGPLSTREILRIGLQTAKGLAAAHAQGLVHRDVKPSNILLDATVERAVLTDFGLARAADDASMTTTGMIAGTPQYMSPEQVRGQAVDARSDLFGLGCVLYFLATSQPPFQADNSYAVLRLITDEEPRPVCAVNPDIPEWLGRIIARLMSKSTDDRYATANEVAVLLEACLSHVQQPTQCPLPLSLAPSRKPSLLSRCNLRQRLLLCGFGGLIAIAALFWYWQAISNTSESPVGIGDSITVRMIREIRTNVAPEQEIVFQCKDRVVRVSGDERVRVPLARPTRLFAWHYGGEPVVFGEEDVGPIYHEVECIREAGGLVIWRLYEWSN